MKERVKIIEELCREMNYRFNKDLTSLFVLNFNKFKKPVPVSLSNRKNRMLPTSRRRWG